MPFNDENLFKGIPESKCGSVSYAQMVKIVGRIGWFLERTSSSHRTFKNEIGTFTNEPDPKEQITEFYKNEITSKSYCNYCGKEAILRSFPDLCDEQVVWQLCSEECAIAIRANPEVTKTPLLCPACNQALAPDRIKNGYKTCDRSCAGKYANNQKKTIMPCLKLNLKRK